MSSIQIKVDVNMYESGNKFESDTIVNVLSNKIRVPKSLVYLNMFKN